MVLFLVWIALSLFIHYALRIRVRRHDYKLCVQCGYDLRGQNPQDRCPECGREFDIDQVQRAWREYLSLRRL